MMLSANIKFLRKRDHLSQEQWGKMFELTRGMVDSYERATARPGIEKLQTICKHYNIILDEICHRDLSGHNFEIIKNAGQSSMDLMAAKDQIINTQTQLIEYLKAQIVTLTVPKSK